MQALVRATAERVGEPVQEAYVDVHGPTLPEVLRRGSVVVPLFLAAGYHVRVDIAGAAARSAGVRVTDPLGPSPLLLGLLAERLEEVGVRREDAVVLAAAGSSDDSAAEAARWTAHGLGAVLRRPVSVAYGASRAPSVGDEVARLRARGAPRVVVVSYLLATGHFHRQLSTAGADAVTAPLLTGGEVDPRLVDLVASRWREADRVVPDDRTPTSAPPTCQAGPLVRIC